MEHSSEWLRERGADWKERETELYREFALLAQVAVAAKDTGSLASVTVKGKDEIETWGGVGEQWGTDIDSAVEPESPLNPKWWAAILDCPDPEEALETAMHEQLGSTQIRRRFGVVRHQKPDPPAYSGTAKVGRCAGWLALFHLDLAEEKLELEIEERVDLVVRRRAK